MLLLWSVFIAHIYWYVYCQLTTHNCAKTFALDFSMLRYFIKAIFSEGSLNLQYIQRTSHFGPFQQSSDTCDIYGPIHCMTSYCSVKHAVMCHSVTTVVAHY